MTFEDLDKMKSDLAQPSFILMVSDPRWKQAFKEYNDGNTIKLNMNCRPCYNKVYQWHYLKLK